MKKIKNIKSTKEVTVPKKIVDQVIGQEKAVNIIKKAAINRRHVLLIGEPGTGKSMLGLALAELLPKKELQDVLVLPNPEDENTPLIKTVEKGMGKSILEKARIEQNSLMKTQGIGLFILNFIVLAMPWVAKSFFNISDVVFAAYFLGSIFFFIGITLISNAGLKKKMRILIPKLIIDKSKEDKAPFFDATGAHAGALFGDVLHDPFQSGGLGTPAHERVVPGMIHKANMGVLFIDEVSTLQYTTQQELLTAIQEGKFPITGQSERSAGAMVRTEAVPCNFILIAAGNLEILENMHPALRSRIRGYGYEVYMENSMPDTEENRYKLVQFIAQEVRKGELLEFDNSAIMEIIEEARKRAGRKYHLTLRLRELGGILRSASDIAMEEKAKIVTKDHVLKSKQIARSLENQLSDKSIEMKKEYSMISQEGSIIGKINGLAVMGANGVYSGIISIIEAVVTENKLNPRVFATGKLGEIAKESVTNVSAFVKKIFNESLQNKDIYIQFLQSYEGVEGDSASCAIATAIVSSLRNIPIMQNVAMTGSLSVRGEVLPIGGVSAKVEAAIDAGMKKVIVPKSNVEEIVIKKERLSKIEIVPTKTIKDVLLNSLNFENNKEDKKLIEEYII
ncbi:MAG: ATP-dependent protease LonB [Candidatus Nanoarchaeia archaeon]|nr:ATP-dependent protease LonB [Candidatus Nanoarchaeia archaeon]